MGEDDGDGLCNFVLAAGSKLYILLRVFCIAVDKINETGLLFMLERSICFSV